MWCVGGAYSHTNKRWRPVCYARDRGQTSFLRLHCSANLHNFGSCDERRHRQAWRFSRALCTRPRFRFGQDCPTQLSLSTVCPYLALFLFRNRRQLACFRAQKKAKAIFASIQPDSTPAKYTRATETGEKNCKPVATAEVAAASGSARRQPVLLLSSCMRRLPWVDFKDDPGQQSQENLGWEVGPGL